MRIVDLVPEYETAWLHSLEPYSEELRDGVERKRAWYHTMRERGLIVKLAVADDGAIAGMVQSLPIEQTWVGGEGLHLILCIWVYGHKAGIGDRRGAGLSRALLLAIETEIRLAGGLGVAAWGMALPFWMRAGWFKKQGYVPVDRVGIATLLWKPFCKAAQPPHCPSAKPVSPPLEPEKVTVTCLDSGGRTPQNANCERARRAAQAAGEAAAFRRVDTIAPEAAEPWTQSYASGSMIGC